VKRRLKKKIIGEAGRIRIMHTLQERTFKEALCATAAEAKGTASTKKKLIKVNGCTVTVSEYQPPVK
jgi:hypothetical protein